MNYCKLTKPYKKFQPHQTVGNSTQKPRKIAYQQPHNKRLSSKTNFNPKVLKLKCNEKGSKILPPFSHQPKGNTRNKIKLSQRYSQVRILENTKYPFLAQRNCLILENLSSSIMWSVHQAVCKGQLNPLHERSLILLEK